LRWGGRARAISDLHLEGSPLRVIAGFLWSCPSLSAVGFDIASLVRAARGAQVIGMIIFYAMLFFSGAGLPREMLPEGGRSFSKFLPLTHVVTLLQGMWLGEPWSASLIEVVVLAIVLIVGAAVATRTVRWE